MRTFSQIVKHYYDVKFWAGRKVQNMDQAKDYRIESELEPVTMQRFMYGENVQLDGNFIAFIQ